MWLTRFGSLANSQTLLMFGVLLLASTLSGCATTNPQTKAVKSISSSINRGNCPFPLKQRLVPEKIVASKQSQSQIADSFQRSWAELSYYRETADAMTLVFCPTADNPANEHQENCKNVKLALSASTCLIEMLAVIRAEYGEAEKEERSLAELYEISDGPYPASWTSLWSSYRAYFFDWQLALAVSLKEGLPSCSINPSTQRYTCKPSRFIQRIESLSKEE